MAAGHGCIARIWRRSLDLTVHPGARDVCSLTGPYRLLPARTGILLLRYGNYNTNIIDTGHYRSAFPSFYSAGRRLSPWSLCLYGIILQSSAARTDRTPV